MKNQRKMLILIIAITLVTLIGSSYALLKSTNTGTNPYVMNVGNLQVNFVNNIDTISLVNAYPMTDEEGMNQTDILEFTVTNNGNLKATYNVYIEETSTNPEFKTVIRYAVNKNDAGYSDAQGIDKDNMLYIDKDAVIGASKSVNYKVKIWLSEEADNTYMNKEFTARIVVDSRQRNEVEVTFDNNLFQVDNETRNGITIDFDKETSILTINGTTSENVRLSYIDNLSFNIGDKYDIYATYVSGNITGSGISALVADVVTSNHLSLSPRNNLRRNLYPVINEGFELIVNENDVLNGYGLLLWIWNNDVEHTFNNYQVKVELKQTKLVEYNGIYGKLPNPPEREGYTFMGWNGKNLFNIDDYMETYAPYQNNKPEKILFEGEEVWKMYGQMNEEGRSIKYMKGLFKENNQYTLSLNIYDVAITDSNGIKWGGMHPRIHYINIEMPYYIFNRNPIAAWEKINYVSLKNETIDYLDYSYGTGSAYTYIKNWQIEEGDIATEWEPYYVTAATKVTQAKNHILKAIWKENE